MRWLGKSPASDFIRSCLIASEAGIPYKLQSSIYDPFVHIPRKNLPQNSTDIEMTIPKAAAFHGFCFLLHTIFSYGNPMPTQAEQQLEPRIIMATPAPRLERRDRLHKRGYVDVCASGQTTDCPLIGVDQVTEVNSGKYVPVCDDNGSCRWIGYADPTSDLGGAETYSIVTSSEVEYVVPVVVGSPPEVVPPPPPAVPEILEPPMECKVPLSFDINNALSMFSTASTLISWLGQIGDFDFAAASATSDPSAGGVGDESCTSTETE